MAEFRDSIDIGAPPETVFEYLTTNDGMTAWMGSAPTSTRRPEASSPST